MKKLGLGDSVKMLEMAEAGRKAMPGLPVMARLDGRAFHSLTRKFERPYDGTMSHCMVETTKALVKEFKPACGYTQSDEITLAWLEPDLFDGRFQKLTSVLAGYASAVFDRLIREGKGDNAPKMVACFDCRVWQVPSIQDAIDVFVWREDDATKNSLTMAAGSVYSHKQLMGVRSAEKHNLLHAKGINWDKYPAHFKRGIYVKRVVEERSLTHEELEKLPPKARARQEGVPVIRASVQVLDMPPIRKFEEATEVLLGVKRFYGIHGPRYKVISASPLKYCLDLSLGDEKVEEG